MERKKLELEVNKSIRLALLFDSPITGESQYGKYYMYGVKNGDTEYSFYSLRRLKSTKHLRVSREEQDSSLQRLQHKKVRSLCRILKLSS